MAENATSANTQTIKRLPIAASPLLKFPAHRVDDGISRYTAIKNCFIRREYRVKAEGKTVPVSSDISHAK
ncbi:hypothetical protein KQS06HV_140031 [Klebsiella quasipneumoniae subsp. similipneumoniae]|nr:hypothetical protein NUKP74_45420 [Klebsiella quasipneumoniae]SAY74242.1 hypothetical protein KQS06HV_140031 [Klebsiella quasipneumoniae subsp. similipneumoniae]